jgi:xeroderma pigmentosum group C-complementing protein
VLERHLKREEVIWPRKQIGLMREEPVFPRSSVVEVRSAEQYMREGMRVKEGEQPLKMVKSRAVTINRRRAHELALAEGREEDTMQGLYARWQTVKSIPPPIVDGKIPKNAYGNLDLFAPHMLPKGAAHLPCASR